MKLNFSLNQKLTILIFGIVIGLMTSIMFIGNLSTHRAIEKKIRNELLTAKKVFEYFQQDLLKELLTSNQIISDVPYLKAVVNTPGIDHATLLDNAQTAHKIVKSDLFILVDPKGKLLASVSAPDQYGDDLSQVPALANTLQGQNYLGLWTTPEGVYLVVTSPFLFDNTIIGGLLMGHAVDKEMLNTLSKITDSEISLITPHLSMTSSSAKLQLGHLELKESLYFGGDINNQIFTKTFNEEKYLLLILPLDKDNKESGFYVVARSLDKELLFYRRLHKRLFLLGGIILLLALLLGMIYTQKITKPIKILLKGTQQIAQGDFSLRVKIFSKDELGQLAESFNTMTQNLNDLVEKEKVFAAKVADADATRKKAEDLEKAYNDIAEKSRQLMNAQKTSLKMMEDLENEREKLKTENIERERVEKELKITNEELAENEKKVRIMLADLQKTHNDLRMAQGHLVQSEKLISMGQLSAGVAHEINNPIGFINSNLETLEQYLESYAKVIRVIEKLKDAVEQNNLPQAQAAAAELSAVEEEINFVFINSDIDNLIRESRAGVDRIRKIVNDLKTFAREGEDVKEPVKVEEIIEGIISIVWNELKYKAELKKDFGPTPLINANAQKLGQVFINLLINASHAIEDKGVIEIKTFEKDENIFIEIHDTGKGISPENLKKIFDPFFTTKPVGTGTGLGLSISYEVIKKHGGEMTVASELGKGTTFTIMLPVKTVEADMVNT